MTRKPLQPEPEIRWDDFLDWIADERAARRDLEGTPWRPLWFALGALLFVVSLVFLGYATGTQGHWWLWLGVLTPLVVLAAMVSRAWRKIERDGALASQLDRMEQAWKSAQGFR
jgi:hypothetical protein